jgi:hypothetical protein
MGDAACVRETRLTKLSQGVVHPRVEANETVWRMLCLLAVVCMVAGTAASSVSARPGVAAVQVALRAHGL